MPTMKQPKNSARKVVSLVRVSTKKQSEEDKTGIPRQREDIQLHCNANGLEMFQEFALEGISGTKVQTSAEYKNLLKVLARPDVCGIVFATLDRFFRPEDIASFSDVFKPIKALGDKALFCDLGELHPFGNSAEAATDNMKLQLWGAMGGFERAKMRDRMSRGMKAKGELPDTCTRKRPEGVVFKRHNEKVNSGVFGFNEFARTVIAPAFKRAAAGDRLMQIVRDMAKQAKAFGIELGHSNGYGNFGTKSVRDTLRSRWWLCEKPNGVRANFGEWKDEQGGLMTAQPLVSETLWQQVQDRLKRNTDSDNWSKLTPIKQDFLAAGLMFCGKCGWKMYHKYKRDGRTQKMYAIYECSNRQRNGTKACNMPRVMAHGKPGKDAKMFPIGSQPLWAMENPGTDELLAAEIEYQLTKCPEIIAAAIQDAINANQSDEKRAQLAAEEKAVRDMERKVSNYTDALGEAETKEIRQSIGKKLEQVGMELATARTNAAMLAKELKAAVDPAKAAAHVQEVFANFYMLPKAEQRVLLEKYVAKIVYDLPPAGEVFNLEVKMRVAEDFEQPNTETAL